MEEDLPNANKLRAMISEFDSEQRAELTDLENIEYGVLQELKEQMIYGIRAYRALVEKDYSLEEIKAVDAFYYKAIESKLKLEFIYHKLNTILENQSYQKKPHGKITVGRRINIIKKCVNDLGKTLDRICISLNAIKKELNKDL